MRVGAGQKQFELSLVATVEPPPPVELLPPPDLHDSFETAYRAAMLAAEPAERTALLRVLSRSIAGAPASAPWAASLRMQINASLAAEVSDRHRLQRPVVIDAGSRRNARRPRRRYQPAAADRPCAAGGREAREEASRRDGGTARRPRSETGRGAAVAAGTGCVGAARRGDQGLPETDRGAARTAGGIPQVARRYPQPLEGRMRDFCGRWGSAPGSHIWSSWRSPRPRKRNRFTICYRRPFI